MIFYTRDLNKKFKIIEVIICVFRRLMWVLQIKMREEIELIEIYL